MSKYLIKFPKSSASAVAEYNDEGHLLSYTLEPGTFEKTQFEFLTRNFPKSEALMNKWILAKFANVVIQQVDEDLSFERFYNTYDYKISKRSTAEKSWNKLSDTNKLLALKFIPKYEAQLRKTGIGKKYPETYLNQEIWNN
jgi:hypothetical protein